MGLDKKIEQNPQRYRELNERKWQVSASKEITPLVFEKSIPLDNMIKELMVDGIIVKIGQSYLISPSTYEEITNGTNPHYNSVPSGKIKIKDKEVIIGNTVPIIELDITKLSEIGNKRDVLNRNAGVRSVDYVYEGVMDGDIPMNLINQINYTLNPDINRPEDTYSIWNIELSDLTTTYSIQTLNVQSAQTDGKLDKVKLNSFLTDINNRLSLLRKDFNMIKSVFHNASTPDSIGWFDYKEQATTEDSDKGNQNHTIIFKDSAIKSNESNPQQKTTDALTQTTDTVNTTKTDLVTQINQQAEEFKKAQAGDALAQQQLNRALAQYQAKTAELAAKLK